MCRIVLVLVIGLCVWPCDAWAFSIGPVTCPAQNRRLTPAEFAIAGEQGSFVDNITYVLSDPGEYKLAGEIHATNFSSGSRACFIGSDSANVVIKAATGKWHVYLQDTANFQLGFKSLTLLGERGSKTGGINLFKSLIAMEDVVVSNCGLQGVQLASCPTTDPLVGYFNATTFTNNTGAFSLADATKALTEPMAVFYGTTKFLANNGGEEMSPGMYLAYANATFYGPTIFRNNRAVVRAYNSSGAIGAINSTLKFTAAVSFTGNRGNAAGAVLLFGSNLAATDSATFESNSALLFTGGAVSAFLSNLKFRGPLVVKANEAPIGGAIFLQQSSMLSGGSCAMEGNGAVSSSPITAGTTHEEQFSNAIPSTALTSQPITKVTSTVADAVTLSTTSLSQIGTRHGFATFGTAAGTPTGPFQSARVAASNLLPAGAGGALSMEVDSVALFRGSTIFSNNGAEFGGGLALTQSQVVFRGPVVFKGHVAQAAGAVLAISGGIKATNTAVFEDNHATVQSGGALLCTNGSTYFRKRVTFKGNSAKYNGGAIAVGDNSILTFKSLVDLDGNSVKHAGGAIGVVANASVKIEVHSMHLRGNKAKFGGGISLDTGIRGNVTIGDLLASQNIGQFGGAVSVASELVVTGDAMFTGNTAKKTGGAISVIGSMTLHKACFIGNKAPAGAAMAITGRVKFNTSDGLQNFYNNTALNGGETSTIAVVPLVVNGTEAGIACDGSDVHVPGGGLITVEGPLCAKSCPLNATVCTCPARTHFMVKSCSCSNLLEGAAPSDSADVQLTLAITPSVIKLGGLVQLDFTVSALSGTAASVQLTVDVPKVLWVGQVPSGCRVNPVKESSDGTQLLCTLLNIQAGHSQVVTATAKANKCGQGSVVANITSLQGVDPRQSSSSADIIIQV